MRFFAEIDVMPHPELLDPQGKAVRLGLEHLGLEQVADVRVGKHIRLAVDAATEAEARAQVETACQQLLANPIMEGYSFRLMPSAESSIDTAHQSSAAVFPSSDVVFPSSDAAGQ